MAGPVLLPGEQPLPPELWSTEVLDAEADRLVVQLCTVAAELERRHGGRPGSSVRVALIRLLADG